VKYNVFYYMTFHTKILDIEADSMEEAVAKGIDDAWLNAHENRRIEFAEECTGALCDEQGDDDYVNSRHFTQQETYDAESRNEHTQDPPEGRSGSGSIPEETPG